ncbi:Gp138 family membrane-puncturing spike protein [Pseudomonas guariconensis]|uniref:Gp138 family membrane-puncturing spike protein n=1 Tax=Pseudomonas guariconensis TaxID=1288410 RepID=UPI0018D8250A|nr:Gp138 family membrane-puncturing spike protein [Pseudomonas guariconensis]MBH3360768.1 hypothetical protein [Pseudomonas guariconensis]
MLKIAQRSAQSKLWTSLPGIIQSFDAGAMTCVVQPAVQVFVTADDGSMVLTTLPLLLDCPVQFPAGGGCTLTFPVKTGDECLVVFASRCIDSWWQSGGIQAQAELRMHDLSDGFALLGFRSQPRVISGISLQAVQLRSDDGAAFVEVNPTNHAINITTNSVVNLTAPAINLAAAGQTLLKFVKETFQALYNGHTHASGGAGVPNQQMNDTHMTTTVKGG